MLGGGLTNTLTIEQLDVVVVYDTVEIHVSTKPDKTHFDFRLASQERSGPTKIPPPRYRINLTAYTVAIQQ